MKKYLVIIFFIVVTLFFFYPIFLGKVPFPGDLLLAEYQPWRSYSFDGIAAGGVPNKAQYFDTLRQLYPWKTLAIDTIKSNSFPLWNPYNFSGTPLFANFQSSILYPLNIFYMFFSQIVSWTILVILQPLLSLIFFYLLARKSEISRIGSTVSSIAYSFSLFMTTFLEYNTIGHFMYLLPAGILAIEYLYERRAWAPILIASVIASSIFAGHLQLFGGVFAFLLLYSLYKFFNLKKKYSLKVRISPVVAITIGIGIGAIQLIPGLELVSISSRASHAKEFIFNNLLINPDQLILYFIPDLFGNPAVKNYTLPYSYPSKALYVGMATIILFFFGLFSKRNRILSGILFASGIFALIVFLSPVSLLLYSFNLPIISTSSPSNFIFLVSLGLCLIAGLGYDNLSSLKPKIMRTISIGLVSVFAVIFALFTFLNIGYSKNNFLYSAILLLIVLAVVNLSKLPIVKKMVGFILILLIVLDLFYFFHKFNPFVNQSFVYPDTPIADYLANSGIDRSWGYSYGHISPNFQTQLGVFSTEGYDPLYFKKYQDLLILTGMEASRSDALVVNGFGNEDISRNPGRLKFLSITGTKTIIDKAENGSTEQTFPEEYFQLREKIGDFSIFDYQLSAPRIFLTKNYTMDKKIFLESKNHQLILLNEPVKLSAGDLVDQNVEIVEYLPEKVTLKTFSDTDSLLYFSDTNYPGWKAYVDDVPSKILDANLVFRSIILPEGNHVVVFKFEPDSFRYGLYISIASIIILLTFYILSKKNVKKN